MCMGRGTSLQDTTSPTFLTIAWVAHMVCAELTTHPNSPKPLIGCDLQLLTRLVFSIFYSLMIWPGQPNHDLDMAQL